MSFVNFCQVCETNWIFKTLAGLKWEKITLRMLSPFLLCVRVQHLEGMCLEVKFIPLSIRPELLFDKFLIHESRIVIILLKLIYSFVLSICYLSKVEILTRFWAWGARLRWERGRPRQTSLWSATHSWSPQVCKHVLKLLSFFHEIWVDG